MLLAKHFTESPPLQTVAFRQQRNAAPCFLTHLKNTAAMKLVANINVRRRTRKAAREFYASPRAMEKPPA
jgi:hypothetical protein